MQNSINYCHHAVHFIPRTYLYLEVSTFWPPPPISSITTTTAPKIFALLKDYPFPQKDWEPLLYNVISGGLQEICHNLRCRVKKSTLIFILIAKYLVTKYQKRKYSIQKQ